MQFYPTTNKGISNENVSVFTTPSPRAVVVSVSMIRYSVQVCREGKEDPPNNTGIIELDPRMPTTSLATQHDARYVERIALIPCRQENYQRLRAMYCCCCCICLAGETDGGGLATLRVLGSTIGIALRVRCASGWCSFV